MRRFIATFFVALAVLLAEAAFPPIRQAPSLWVWYASAIAPGLAASLVGRGLAGFIAFYLGYWVAHLLALGLGFFSPPDEAEIIEALFYRSYGSIVGTAGYLGPVLIRFLLRRTRPRRA